MFGKYRLSVIISIFLSILFLLETFPANANGLTSQTVSEPSDRIFTEADLYIDSVEDSKLSSSEVNQSLGQLRICYEVADSEMPLLRSAAPTTNRMVQLTNDVLLSEIELLKLNTNFRRATTDKGRTKPWRVFLYNLAGSGVATAGITTIAAERWRTWQRPATASRNTLQAGPTMLLISHSVITAGVLFEAALDFVGDYKLRKKGLDSKSTKKRAIELRDQIDRQLAERESLLTALSQEDSELARAEGLVLKDIRNLALSEYSQFHVRAARRKAARNFSYINGFSAATTGGYLGSLCGLLAVAERNPRLAGPAGIGFTISGANIASGPLLGRLTSNVAGSITKRKLARDLGTFAPAPLQDHFNALKQSTLHDDASLQTRLALYQEVDSIFKNQAKMNAAEKKKADKEFLERCMWNAAIGGTKMSWGIQLANAGFNFHPRPPAKAPTVPVKFGGKTINVQVGKKPKSPAELFAQRVAQGSTSYIPGTSLWILDTLQARARSEMDLYTMGSQDSLPHQKLNARMVKLEDLERSLKKDAP